MSWDTDAFWYPSRDRQTALLALFLLLGVLHFDELLGLHTSSVLVFGFWPVEFFYQAVMVIAHTAFMYLLYRSWPLRPEDSDG